MRKIVATALAAAIAVPAGGVPAFAQAGSALGLIVHSMIVSRCEDRELTHEEAGRTALGFSGMWKAMRDCRENMAKREAAAAKKKK